MADEVPKQYWDSCLFINFLSNHERKKAESVAPVGVKEHKDDSNTRRPLHG